jgi:YfiR/HmsC-like
MRSKFVLLLIYAMALSFVAKGQTTNYQAYSVFVYGMTKYMSWPSSNRVEFVIVVFGKSKVYDEMVKGLAGKTVNGLPIKIVQAEDASTVGEPQILYMSEGKSGQLDEIKKLTAGKAVLIIGEREGLHKKGAGMSFIAIDNKLRIDINNVELLGRNIKTSTQMQALAHEII